ncbi:MAG: acetylglutamate kinase [Bacteroidota bacterium]
MNKKPLYIIKIGGNIIDNPEALDSFLEDFSSIKIPKILIHGGGKIATTLAEKMGIETVMVEGRRITDKDTIDLVTMVYGGLINKNIVAKLQSKACNAIGLTGADGASIVSEKRPVTSIDYGFVGDVKAVNYNFISNLLKENVTPIFAPLTADNKGQILNTNADTMAKEIAVSLSKIYDVNLIYCFEKNGVLKDINDENSVVSLLQYTQYQSDKENGSINKGMIPKLDNAFDAKKNGVAKVLICHAKNLLNFGTDKQVGTEINL